MNAVIPLMQREWLQHRMAWTLMLVLPLAVAILPLSFGEVVIGDVDLEGGPLVLETALALGALAAGVVVSFAVVALSSLILMNGLARRDHGDRSHEFWLSLPVGHGVSLGVPLLVHLLIVPAVALVFGLFAGVVASLPLVAKVGGWAAWVALPWAELLTAAAALTARLLVGLPLALLWISPILLALVLLGAWFGRWGVVILGVGVGLGSAVLDRLLGQPWPAMVLGRWFEGAGRSLAGASEVHHAAWHDAAGNDLLEALRLAPQFAAADLGAAFGMLASPMLLAGLLVAGACFALLVRWRAAGG